MVSGMGGVEEVVCGGEKGRRKRGERRGKGGWGQVAKGWKMKGI